MASEKTMTLGNTTILLSGVRSIGYEQGTVEVKMLTGSSYMKLYNTEQEAHDVAEDLVELWKEYLAYA